MQNKGCLAESRSAGAQSSTALVSFRRNEGSAIVLHCQLQGVVLLALLTSHSQKTLLAYKAGECQMQVSALGTLDSPV